MVSPRFSAPTILLGGLAIVALAGCSTSGVRSLIPWRRATADSVPGVTPPTERMAILRDLRQQAGKMAPEKTTRIAASLAQRYHDEKDQLIRAEIVRTIAVFATPASDAVLNEALDDPEAQVRIAACQAWVDHRGEQAVARLAGLLGSDVDQDVRLAAARALGKTGSQAAVAPLGQALEDRDPAMQYRAVRSLEEVTGENLGDDVDRWQQYVRGETPAPAKPVSIAQRLRGLF